MFQCIQILCCCFGLDLTKFKLRKDVWFMDAKTQEAMRDVSHYTANHFTEGRQKWFAFIKIDATEVDAKPVFDCLLGAFLFG